MNEIVKHRHQQHTKTMLAKRAAWSGKRYNRHVVSVGGGLSSYQAAIKVAEMHPGKTDFVIAALAGESPDLWKLVNQLESETGIPVTRIAYNPAKKYFINPPHHLWWGIWDVFFKTGMMGNSRVDPCSRILKRETMKHFMLDNYDTETTVMHVGITADEIDRMLAIRRNWSKIGFTINAPLGDTNYTGDKKQRAMSLLGWIPEMYDVGMVHNNCAGFCVKAGHSQMARLLWYHPDLYAYHERNEIRFQRQFDTTATIMRDQKTTDGKYKSWSLTMTAFRERMQQRWSGRLPGFDPFEGLASTPGCVFCGAA